MSGDLTTYEKALQQILEKCRRNLSTQKPSEWAETKRLLSSEVSPIRGYYKFSHTPYIRDILNHLSPEDGARLIVIMKAAQLGLTVGLIENAIPWIIDQDPSNILYLVGHADLLKTSAGQLDHAIDSCGIRSKIKATTQRVRNQKSGDTDKLKQFQGGYCKIGITNAKSLRNISVKYSFIDDFEAMPKTSKKAGDILTLILKRHTAYRSTMKSFILSSPELKGGNIESAYLLGDQRQYFVPCPCCGEFITLAFFGVDVNGEKRGGMIWELDKNQELIEDSVAYQCQECSGTFTDENKLELTNLGEWRPTAKPQKPGYVSYQVNALISPPFMPGWVDYVYEYLIACPPGQERNESKYQGFLNLNLGETYAPPAISIDTSELQRNIREYEPMTVPEALSKAQGNGSIVMLTCGVDFGGSVEDARVDLEVVAYAKNGATYSVDMHNIGTFSRFGADKHDPGRQKWTYRHGEKYSVWPLLDQYLNQEFTVDVEGSAPRTQKILITALDSGYFTDYVYQFRNESTADCVCIKGQDDAQPISKNTNVKTYKHSQEMKGKLYLAQTNIAKDKLARYMGLKWNPNSQAGQPAGFLNFPQPKDGKYLYQNYFAHFAAEHKIIDERGRMIWKKKSTRHENHLFDCNLYSMIAKDIFTDILCAEWKIQPSSWDELITKMGERGLIPGDIPLEDPEEQNKK